MLVNKTSHKFTGKLRQKVDKTKSGHNYKIILLFLGHPVVLSLCEFLSMKMKSAESLPIKERIAMKRYQNCSYQICTKISFCLNLGKDQFIFVKNKNVQN